MTALERAIAAMAAPDELAAEQDAWREAAAATPHGQPILLKHRVPRGRQRT